jgi:hypothetical protein
MLMDRFGYILSEAPVLFLMIWFAVRFVQLRRARENRPLFSEGERRMLFHASHPPRTWRFYSRFALAVISLTAIGILEIFIFAPFGAAIVSGVLLLTAATIVWRILLADQ